MCPKENKYVIFTTLPLKKADDRYANVEGYGSKFITSYTSEPQILEFFDKYPVSEVIAIGTEESTTAVIPEKQAEKNGEVAKSIDDLFSDWVNESNLIYYDLWNSVRNEVKSKYPGKHVKIRLIKSSGTDIAKYWADVYDCLAELKSDGKVHILNDIQGGDRTERYIQNSLLMILQNDPDIVVEKVLGSTMDSENIYINDYTELYSKTEQLTSGFASLTRYGRTDLLADYCSNLILAKEEQKVIDAMRELDHAIALSNATRIKSSANELNIQFKNCSSIKDPNPIFKSMLNCISQNYGGILTCKDDDIRIFEIIKWCLDKDFLQQALTLFESQTTAALCKIFKIDNYHNSDDLSKCIPWYTTQNNSDLEKVENGHAIVCGNKVIRTTTDDNNDKLKKVIKISKITREKQKKIFVYYTVIKIIRNITNHGSGTSGREPDADNAFSYLRNAMHIQNIPSENYDEIKNYISEAVEFVKSNAT